MTPRLPASSALSRRQFLGASAQQAAGVAAGVVGWAATAQSDISTSPNERLDVAVIGVRNQGRVLANVFAEQPDVCVRTVCDVDRQQAEICAGGLVGSQQLPPGIETDYRRVLDDPAIRAVVVATPDHWHAPIVIQACAAGKDVYVETPCSATIAEGYWMLAAARQHQRIVQTGLQERSGAHFQSAMELLRSKALGSVRLARAWVVHRRKPIGHKGVSPAPGTVDYNQWLGPAAAREFDANRFHFNWRWFWEYGGGELTHWGSHWLDVARWGLGVEWPQRVSACGGKLHFVDDQETPDTLTVHYEYHGRMLQWEHRLWSGHGLEGRNAGVAFYGENGTLIVDRGGWKVYDRAEVLVSEASELQTSHIRNFVDCVKTRTPPAAALEIGHVSAGLCHLGNIAYRLGRDIRFDAQQLRCPQDAAATALLTRKYREGFGIERAESQSI